MGKIFNAAGRMEQWNDCAGKSSFWTYDGSDALCLRAELLAGLQLHERGGAVNVSVKEWLDRWPAFRPRSTEAGVAKADVQHGAR